VWGAWCGLCGVGCVVRGVGMRCVSSVGYECGSSVGYECGVLLYVVWKMCSVEDVCIKAPYTNAFYTSYTPLITHLHTHLHTHVTTPTIPHPRTDNSNNTPHTPPHTPPPQTQTRKCLKDLQSFNFFKKKEIFFEVRKKRGKQKLFFHL